MSHSDSKIKSDLNRKHNLTKFKSGQRVKKVYSFVTDYNTWRGCRALDVDQEIYRTLRLFLNKLYHGALSFDLNTVENWF